MKGVTFEWKVETIDRDGEIVDVEFFDAFADAIDFIESNPPEGDVMKYDVCLVRDEAYMVDSERGIDGRLYAYVVDRYLPQTFDDGSTKVPIRFIREVEQANDERI